MFNNLIRQISTTTKMKQSIRTSLVIFAIVVVFVAATVHATETEKATSSGIKSY